MAISFTISDVSAICNPVITPTALACNIIEKKSNNSYLQTIVKIVQAIPMSILSLNSLYILTKKLFNLKIALNILDPLTIPILLIPGINFALKKVADHHQWETCCKILNVCDKIYMTASKITNLAIISLGLSKIIKDAISLYPYVPISLGLKIYIPLTIIMLLLNAFLTAKSLKQDLS